MTDLSYEGWTNYETWCVHLWLSNEQGTDMFAREQASREFAYEVQADDAFREFVEEIYSIDHLRGLAGDLVNAALACVDWREVREAFLDKDE